MQIKEYKHIFFDLDRTLWDFERNSNETFLDIHRKYDLKNKGVTDFDHFMDVYHKINLELWDHYRKGEIKKEVLNVKRFALTLDSFGIDDETLSENIARDYVAISPTKQHLFPGTINLLEYLYVKYPLYIITNGFEEVQHRKLEISGLGKYFKGVITSEDAGFKKPDVNIFKYACAVAGAIPEESIMIGDDPEVDIMGAREAGMDQLLVDYASVYETNISTYYVNSLEEIIKLL
jgi:putative hydrolase of the HAD superfamily